MYDALSTDEVIVLNKIRNRGFAVVVFTQKEINDASPESLEDYLIEKGWDFISENQESIED